MNPEHENAATANAQPKSDIFVLRYDSPIGILTLTGTEDVVTGLHLPGPESVLIPPDRSGSPALRDASRWLSLYFGGKQVSPEDLPLSLSGTAFRLCIWNLLREIPYGALTTYGELAAKAAERLGKERMSARAVGGAVGSNPIAIIIPCHRVIGSGNALTGFGGGLAMKTELLRLEGIDTDRLKLPGKSRQTSFRTKL